jgi:hypothetical protein
VVEKVAIVVCGIAVLVAAVEEELFLTTGSGSAAGKTSLNIGKASRRVDWIAVTGRQQKHKVTIKGHQFTISAQLL